MIYVFDTSPLSQLFRSYYPDRFPSLWSQFHELVRDEKILSTREVLRELRNGPNNELVDWANGNEHLFPAPDLLEAAALRDIFSVPHFRQLLEKRKFFEGGMCADPFVIARAMAVEATAVTMEQWKPNGAKIPNVCEHFKVPCMDLEGFMEAEGWKF